MNPQKQNGFSKTVPRNFPPGLPNIHIYNNQGANVSVYNYFVQPSGWPKQQNVIMRQQGLKNDENILHSTFAVDQQPSQIQQTFNQSASSSSRRLENIGEPSCSGSTSSRYLLPK